MLLRGAKLSNTKTSRKGKFAFRLEGNGSSASHRAGREWHKWADISGWVGYLEV